MQWLALVYHSGSYRVYFRHQGKQHHFTLGERDLASLLPDVWAAAHPEAQRSDRAHERKAAAAATRARRRALARAEAQRR